MMSRNGLAKASSPYLLQHADNPVNWHEWGDAAFEEARRRDCPVLLSIGYAACHWCHVMAHESFEDPAIGAQLDRDFVAIKVDREERPDVDAIYMAALHALGVQGGWPLTMFLDTERLPFWGGTYFPPQAKHGLPAFRDVLGSVRKTWDEDRDRIVHNTSGLGTHLRSLGKVGEAPDDVGSQLERHAAAVLDLFDRKRGGLNGAPKFPNAPMNETVLRLAWGGNDEARTLYLQTMRSLCQGGIYDHLGGGLSRYAVDARWHVPHFEKMLYDQAQFIEQVSWAHVLQPLPLWRRRVEETIDFLVRELGDGTVFHASIDADSEGEEGLFYTWTPDESAAVLEDATTFDTAYGIEESGHLDGRSVLHLPLSSDDVCDDLGSAREEMLRARAERVRPALDDKVLTDWNMMTVRSLVLASRVFGRPDWLVQARRCFDHLVAHETIHSSRSGRAGADALLSDHVQTGLAALALYGTGGTMRDLDVARASHAAIVERFQRDGVPVLTPEGSNDLPVRPAAMTDDPCPSAVSDAMRLAVGLGEIDHDAVDADTVERWADALGAHVAGSAYGTAGAANALRRYRDGSTLLTIAMTQPREPDLNRRDVRLASKADLPDNHPARAVSAESFAMLCRARACQPPVFDAGGLDALLV